MKDAIILQQVFSGSQYANMLRLSFNRHCEYAMRHGFDLQVVMANFKPIEAVMHPGGFPAGQWAKVFMIRDALDAGYEFIAWIDADALIYDMKIDLRDVRAEMGESEMGACEHPNPMHLNTGVLYIRNTERARKFVAEWLSKMHSPNEDGWHEQGFFNKMRLEPEWQGVICKVSDKWNATYVAGTDCADAVVKGYHGGPDFTALMRFQAMQADLARVV